MAQLTLFLCRCPLLLPPVAVGTLLGQRGGPMTQITAGGGEPPLPCLRRVSVPVPVSHGSQPQRRLPAGQRAEKLSWIPVSATPAALCPSAALFRRAIAAQSPVPWKVALKMVTGPGAGVAFNSAVLLGI